MTCRCERQLSGGLRVENGECLVPEIGLSCLGKQNRFVNAFGQKLSVSQPRQHKCQTSKQKRGQMGEVTMPISLDFVRVSAHQASALESMCKGDHLEQGVTCVSCRCERQLEKCEGGQSGWS